MWKKAIIATNSYIVFQCHTQKNCLAKPKKEIELLDKSRRNSKTVAKQLNSIDFEF